MFSQKFFRDDASFGWRGRMQNATEETMTKITANTSANNVSFRDWTLIFVLALIWGGSFLFGRILMLEWPPFTVVFLRVALAAITLWVFVLLSRKKWALDMKLIAAIAIMGILNNVIPFSLILIGQREIGSGLASVVNAMTPIWTLVIANFLTTDEKFQRLKVFGIIFGFVGVTVLIGGDLISGFEASAWAQIAVLGATISYGFAGVFGKRFREHDPILISTGQLTASSIVMLPIMLLMENPGELSAPTLEMFISLVGLSVLCTALAYVLFFKILASAGATNVSLVTFLVPVSAIVLGIVWLGETLSFNNIVGMICIVIGLTLIDGRIYQK